MHGYARRAEDEQYDDDVVYVGVYALVGEDEGGVFDAVEGEVTSSQYS